MSSYATSGIWTLLMSNETQTSDTTVRAQPAAWWEMCEQYLDLLGHGRCDDAIEVGVDIAEYMPLLLDALEVAHGAIDHARGVLISEGYVKDVRHIDGMLAAIAATLEGGE